MSSDGLASTFTALRSFAGWTTPKPIFVNCPIVAEVSVPFSCSFASIGSAHPTGNDGVLKVEYVEGGTPETIDLRQPRKPLIVSFIASSHFTN